MISDEIYNEIAAIQEKYKVVLYILALEYSEKMKVSVNLSDFRRYMCLSLDDGISVWNPIGMDPPSFMIF